MSAIWKFLDHISDEEKALLQKPMAQSHKTSIRRTLEVLRQHGARLADDEDRATSTWLIYFDDHEMRPEVFIGPMAEANARARFDQLLVGWSCHLFRSVPPQAP